MNHVEAYEHLGKKGHLHRSIENLEIQKKKK